MTDVLWLLWIFVFAVVLDASLVMAWRHRKTRQTQFKEGEMLADEEKKQFTMKPFTFFEKNAAKFPQAAFMVELLIIVLWAIFVGRVYLDMNPQMIPAGREFSSAVQTHHLWNQFQECGWCAIWNGFERGGYPALADVHGSMLHPVVMATTLFFGVVNGAKIALVIAFGLAGIAQWWLAFELRLGRIPRVWSAAMAVVGGHLSGRMELGAFGVLLASATCSLVLAAILHLYQNHGRHKAIVLLAIFTASALLSGQGYMQVGLLLGVFPAMIFLLINNQRKLLPVWKDYLLAFGLAFLLAAPFLIPFLHFSPNFSKEIDLTFNTAQPLTYLPLNLVIDDWHYYNNDSLGKYPFPHLYTLFIGWIPVILAGLGLMKVPRKKKRIFEFLIAAIILEFLIGSAVLLKWIARLFPGVAGVRHPSQIAGLAVPLILALSAYGLDWLLKRDWPNIWIAISQKSVPARNIFSLKWLLLIPLVFSLQKGYHFSTHWVALIPANETAELLDALKTPSLQWIEPPFGEHFYIEPAVGMGLKLSPGIMTFRWKGREFPVPVIEANRTGPPEGQVDQVDTIDGIMIYARSDQPYAAVAHGDQQTPCTASGSGGELTVICDTSEPGRLIVKENMWTGWKAWMDGERAPLLGANWLEVNAPAGDHTYQFRYLPWDVPLGLALFVAGIVLSAMLWRRENKEQLL